MLGMHEIGAYLGAAHRPLELEDAKSYVSNLTKAGMALMFCAPGTKIPVDLRSKALVKKDTEAWIAEDPEKRAGLDMPGGYNLATTDAARLRTYIKSHYGAPVTNPDGSITPAPKVEPLNIAINPRRSGIAIVDVDTPEELEAFRVWAAQVSGDPAWRNVGVTVSSPGTMRDGQWLHHGGGHIYFGYPLDSTMPLEQLPGSLKVKVPGTGAFSIYLHSVYIMLPPSIRAEGMYQVTGPSHDMPDWMARFLLGEVYRRQQLRAEAQRARSDRGGSADFHRALVEWYPTESWDELLGMEGWSRSGTDRCGCPTFARPGGSSPKSATAHEPGCSEPSYSASEDPPLHVWTSSPNGGIGDMVDLVGPTLSKLQVKAAVEFEGNIGDAVRAAVMAYLESDTEETTFDVAVTASGSKVAMVTSTPTDEAPAVPVADQLAAHQAPQSVPAAPAAPQAPIAPAAPAAAQSVPSGAPIVNGFAPIGAPLGQPQQSFHQLPTPPQQVAQPFQQTIFSPFQPPVNGHAAPGAPETPQAPPASEQPPVNPNVITEGPYAGFDLTDEEENLAPLGHEAPVAPILGAAGNVPPASNAFYAPEVNPFAQASRETNIKPEILSFDDVSDIAPPKFLVQNWIQHGDVSAIIGPPNSGKSVLAIDVACAVAANWNEEFGVWKGRKVMRGKVLYIVGEGFAGVVSRIKAWEHANGMSIRGNLDLVRDPFHLLDTSSDVWLDFAMDMRNKGYTAVIIDTLASTTSGMDENAAGEMGSVIARLNKLSEFIDASVILVHHTAKGTDHARGSSVLHGALASQVLVRKLEEDTLTEDERDFMSGNGLTPVEALITKQKDAQYALPLRLTMMSVELPAPPGYKGQFGDEEMPNSVVLADWAGQVGAHNPALTVSDSPKFTPTKVDPQGPDRIKDVAWAIAQMAIREQAGPVARRMPITTAKVSAELRAKSSINVDGLDALAFGVLFNQALRKAIDAGAVVVEGTQVVPAVDTGIRLDKDATRAVLRQRLGVTVDDGTGAPSAAPLAAPTGPDPLNATPPWVNAGPVPQATVADAGEGTDTATQDQPEATPDAAVDQPTGDEENPS